MPCLPQSGECDVAGLAMHLNDTKFPTLCILCMRYPRVFDPTFQIKDDPRKGDKRLVRFIYESAVWKLRRRVHEIRHAR